MQFIERSENMGDILSNINTLDGFMTNDELTFSLISANNGQLNPPICNDYNGPEEIEEIRNRQRP
jgi:hypothetical protein